MVVPVAFADMVIDQELLAAGSPFGDPEIDELQGIIDTGKRTVRLTRERHKV